MMYNAMLALSLSFSLVMLQQQWQLRTMTIQV